MQCYCKISSNIGPRLRTSPISPPQSLCPASSSFISMQFLPLLTSRVLNFKDYNLREGLYFILPSEAADFFLRFFSLSLPGRAFPFLSPVPHPPPPSFLSPSSSLGLQFCPAFLCPLNRIDTIFRKTIPMLFVVPAHSQDHTYSSINVHDNLHTLVSKSVAEKRRVDIPVLSTIAQLRGHWREKTLPSR